MDEDTLLVEPVEAAVELPVQLPRIPEVPATPITGRFLYVDVASLRAKQLRRGALSRLTSEAPNVPVKVFHKAERTAMEEVRRNLVNYDISDPNKPIEEPAE